MSTISISLPEKTARQIDQEAERQGFSTRSEFIRSLIRRQLSGELEFEPFQPQSLKKIKLELASTGKYSQEFIESVTEGLSKSSPYANQAIKKRPSRISN